MGVILDFSFSGITFISIRWLKWDTYTTKYYTPFRRHDNFLHCAIHLDDVTSTMTMAVKLFFISIQTFTHSSIQTMEIWKSQEVMDLYI